MNSSVAMFRVAQAARIMDEFKSRDDDYAQAHKFADRREAVAFWKDEYRYWYKKYTNPMGVNKYEIAA
jgi:hypothetical protein